MKLNLEEVGGSNQLGSTNRTMDRTRPCTDGSKESRSKAYSVQVLTYCTPTDLQRLVYKASNHGTLPMNCRVNRHTCFEQNMLQEYHIVSKLSSKHALKPVITGLKQGTCFEPIPDPKHIQSDEISSKNLFKT